MATKSRDICVYKGCSNGKSTGHHLFRFPPEADPRQEIWIKCTGQYGNLSKLSKSTLRRSGLCQQHFDPENFVIENNQKLKRNAIPRPWIEETAASCCDGTTANSPGKTDTQHEDQHQPPPTVPKMRVHTMPKKAYQPGNLNFCQDNEDNDMEWVTIVPTKNPSSPPHTVERTRTEEEFIELQQKIKKLQALTRRLELQNQRLRRHMRRLRDRQARIEKNARDNTGCMISKANQRASINAFLDQQRCIQPAARAMITLQLHKARQSFAPDEKDLARQLYYHSASAYSRLRKAGCNFPGESTIRKWIAECDIRCGFSDCIFERLAEKFVKLPSDERVCCLKWDEMHIKEFEEYSQMLDTVEGLADLGPLGRSAKRATNLFVFCIDSINANNPWRQVIAFFLAAPTITATQIHQLLKICLDKLKAVGADVRILTCDQGPSNKMALTSPRHLNASETDPSFHHNGAKYFTSFDFPHLIKRLLYHMRTHGILYCQGKVIVAFQDFFDTWVIDGRQNSSNLLGHISETHLYPHSFDAMNVKRAFQILSHTFASAIKLAGADQNGLKSDTWEASASFAERMNDVIDAHNAYKLTFYNPMRRPLSQRNPNIEKTLLDFADWAAEWSQLPDKIKRPPCFTGLVMTSRAIVGTYRRLSEDFPGFELAAGLCNQDSVEHLFSKIRQRGGHNANPTARMTRLALRHIISTGYIHTGDKGNVQSAEADSLINPVSKVTRRFRETAESAEGGEQPFEEATEITERHVLSSDIATLEKNTKSIEVDSQTSLYTTNAVTFFAGYIAFRMIKMDQCERCQSAMTKTPMEGCTEDEMYIEFREYENPDEDAPKVTKLCRPTDYFAKIVSVQLSAFARRCNDYWSSNTIIKNLVGDLISDTNETFPDWFQASDPCIKHRTAALSFLIRVKVFAKTRSHNQAAKTIKGGNMRASQKNRKLAILQNV